MSEDDGYQLGDWWEPIDTPPSPGTRVMLVIPPVYRPRREGERRMKCIRLRNGRLVKNVDDMIQAAATVSMGVNVDGEWRPGRKSKVNFYAEPTHWMHLPDLPDEYQDD